MNTEPKLRPWQVLERRTVYSAPPYMEVAVETVMLPDGRVIDDYHQVEAGAFSGIIAETDDGRILLMRQYRHGSRRVGLGVPGGRIERGESPVEGAKRELLEETGYAAREWKALASYESSCTYGFNRTHCFYARGLTLVGAPHADDLEQSEIVFITRAEARAAILSGDIISGGHVVPLSLVLLGQEGPAGT